MGWHAPAPGAPVDPPGGAPPPRAARGVCYHCRRAVGDGAAVACHGCCRRFCALCSTLNYDAPEDRAFCLDCDAARRAGGRAGGGGSGCGAALCSGPAGGHAHDPSVWGY